MMFINDVCFRFTLADLGPSLLCAWVLCLFGRVRIVTSVVTENPGLLGRMWVVACLGMFQVLCVVSLPLAWCPLWYGRGWYCR